jgi:hypothetical protein
VTTGSAPVGGNGIFTAGPEVGLLQHSMFIMDGDWGVHTQGGNKINTGIESNESIGWVASASSRGVPLSFDLTWDILHAIALTGYSVRG